MRREAIAAIIVGVAAVSLAVFSISREHSGTPQGTDTLLSVNPIEPGNTLAPSQEYPQPGTAPREVAPAPMRREAPFAAGLTVPAGTGIPVRVETHLSSEHATVGDTWSGVVTQRVYANGRLVVPSGSRVTGTVSAVRPAERGHRAMLQLAMTRLSIGDHTYRARGGSAPIIAGSPRTRNVGAIAGGTAAGALLGKAMSGSGKGALIGGLVGGAVSTGVVAGSKGWQAVVREGTPMTFTLRQSVTVSKRAVNQLALR